VPFHISKAAFALRMPEICGVFIHSHPKMQTRTVGRPHATLGTRRGCSTRHGHVPALPKQRPQHGRGCPPDRVSSPLRSRRAPAALARSCRLPAGCPRCWPGTAPPRRTTGTPAGTGLSLLRPSLCPSVSPGWDEPCPGSFPSSLSAPRAEPSHLRAPRSRSGLGGSGSRGKQKRT